MSVNPHVVTWIEELDSLDLERRTEVKQQLRALGDTVIVELIAAAYSVTQRRCWEAAALLAEIDDPCVAPVMRQLMKSHHPIVVQIAVRTLARQGEENATILVDALSRSPELTRIEIVRGLEQIGSKCAVLPLLDLLRRANSSVLRYTIIQALGRLGDARAINLIRSFENDEDHHVRRRVQLALISLGNAVATRDVQYDA